MFLLRTLFLFDYLGLADFIRRMFLRRGRQETHLFLQCRQPPLDIDVSAFQTLELAFQVIAAQFFVHLRSGTSAEIQELWNVLLVLRRFRVSAPRPVAFHLGQQRGVLVTHETNLGSGPIAKPLPTEALVRLLDRLFLAGLFPRRGFLAGLSSRPDGSLSMVRPEVHRPPVVNRRPLRRSLARLRKELRALGISRDEIREVIERAARFGRHHVG